MQSFRSLPANAPDPRPAATALSLRRLARAGDRLCPDAPRRTAGLRKTATIASPIIPIVVFSSVQRATAFAHQAAAQGDGGKAKIAPRSLLIAEGRETFFRFVRVRQIGKEAAR